MTIRQLYVCLTGFDDNTRVNIFKHDQCGAYYKQDADAVEIGIHDAETLVNSTYYNATLEHFDVVELNEEGYVAVLNIWLSKEGTTC